MQMEKVKFTVACNTERDGHVQFRYNTEPDDFYIGYRRVQYRTRRSGSIGTVASNTEPYLHEFKFA